MKACPIASPSQSWESYEEDLQAWYLSTELKATAVGPHVKSRGCSANSTFKNQAKLLDMTRLSNGPVDETGTNGKLGFGYLVEFMQTENRTNDDVAKIIRFASWLELKRGHQKVEDYVNESFRLLQEVDQDRFVVMEGFVKSLTLIINAQLTQQQLSNLSTRRDLDATLA